MDETETVFNEVEQHFLNRSVMIVKQVLANLVAKLIIRVGKDNQEYARLLTMFCRDVAQCIARHKKEPTLQ
jgi:hypothetical protein